MSGAPPTGTGRPLLGAVLAGLAAAGLAVAAYLTFSEGGGSDAVCVIGSGCDEVGASSYSHLLGVPLAVYGVAWSAVALAAALAWWRTADRRPLYVLYVGGLVATIVEVYLVYLELFVIDAVCSWCALYGITVVLGWLGAVAGVVRASRAPIDEVRPD